MIALSAFGLLALYSARSNYVMAKKNADWTVRYYTLDDAARESVARLEALIGAFPDSSEGLSDSEQSAVSELGWRVIGQNPYTVSKTVTIDTMHMEVTLALLRTDRGEMRWDVLSWREYQDNFDYNQGQDVWQGETIIEE